MKTICKNIAFSDGGKCLLGEKCICKANELWLEEASIISTKPIEQDPSQDTLWDELIQEINALERMEENDWAWNKNILKNQYTITRK